MCRWVPFPNIIAAFRPSVIGSCGSDQGARRLRECLRKDSCSLFILSDDQTIRGAPARAPLVESPANLCGSPPDCMHDESDLTRSGLHAVKAISAREAMENQDGQAATKSRQTLVQDSGQATSRRSSPKHAHARARPSPRSHPGIGLQSCVDSWSFAETNESATLRDEKMSRVDAPAQLPARPFV